MQEQKLYNSGIKINYKSAEKEKISEVFSFNPFFKSSFSFYSNFSKQQ